MDLELEGKTAIVTGGSRGIGKAIVKELALSGCDVVICARNADDLDLPARELSRETGRKVVGIPADTTSTDDVDRMVKQAAEELGRIDILVNNAAIFVPGNIETVQERHINLSLEVNLRSYMLAMREAIPHMRASGGGHIINISSRGAIPLGPGPYTEEQRDRRGDIFYGPEKIALEHFSQGQAATYQEENISVNVLSPDTGVRTAGNRFASNDRENPDLNFETADDMGQATVWICEQPPKGFTGNILYDKPVLTNAGIALKGPFRD